MKDGMADRRPSRHWRLQLRQLHDQLADHPDDPQCKAAVTGAGAVENVANWGNDDTTFDDAFDLGGLPWEFRSVIRMKPPSFRSTKSVRPPSSMAGANDIRVAVAEAYLLDHALHNLGVPSELLIFPGEGHAGKNPWHGKIKVREELKWLQKYGGIPAQ